MNFSKLIRSIYKISYIKGILVEINELGSAMQDIMNQIFHGLAKGIHDVNIVLTIHDAKPSIKNLAENRIFLKMGNWLLMERR